MEQLLDMLWVLIAACLVFFMQAGFAMVESGLTRSKNSINVAIKNLTDLGVSTLFFWLVGFGIMFGKSKIGITGSDNFLFSPATNMAAVFFLFQAMFCSTSATIVSGAIAERVKYGSYIISTLFLSVIIYPLFGHWAWGGLMESETTGWLSKLGFIDFAGSTVVHSLGGWVALAILVIVGSRTGKYHNDGTTKEITGSNIPMVVLGVLILWFGWFGFNGGSTLAMNGSVVSIILKTTLSASAGMIATLAVGWPILKKPDVTLVMNGALAGLVAITAPVHAVTELQSILIGGVGGIVMLFSTFALNKLKIDDAVGAIPVHLAAGAWGTLAVGLFGNLQILNTGLTKIEQIGIQLLGIAACGVWAFGISWIVIKILNQFYPLRIPIEHEIDGLNKSEHGVSTEIFDLYTVLHHQAQTGDITQRAPVEPFTEVGQIANMYNEVLEKLESNTVEKDEYLHILANVSDGMFLLSKEGKIGQYYSASLDKILESNELAGTSLLTVLDGLLAESAKSMFFDFLDLAFDLTNNWRNVERLNPIKEIEASFDDGNGEFINKNLIFNFKRIIKEGVITNLLVLIKDVTEERILNQKIEQNRKKSAIEMELLYRTMHIEPPVLRDFLNTSIDSLNQINSLFQINNRSIRESLEEAFRLSHSLKGDSELLELQFISDIAEELEISMEKILKEKEIDNQKLIPLTIKLSELKSTIEKLNGLISKWSGVSLGKDDSKNEEYNSSNFRNHLYQLSHRLSKKYSKEISLDVEELNIDVLPLEKRKLIREIVIQLLRNSIYHGIELPKIRLQKGKPSVGRIIVKMNNSNGLLNIHFKDDGEGLNIKKIREKAYSSGLITEDQFNELPDSVISKLIFSQGLSTADNPDKTAGKGVGMPLIKEHIKEIKGTISVKTAINKGTIFSLQIKQENPEEILI